MCLYQLFTVSCVKRVARYNVVSRGTYDVVEENFKTFITSWTKNIKRITYT